MYELDSNARACDFDVVSSWLHPAQRASMTCARHIASTGNRFKSD